MSVSEAIEDLRNLLKMLIKNVQDVQNDIEEVKNDINILKIEVRKIGEEIKSKDKKIDKKLIEKEITRIGKKHVEQENIIIESGSMDDEFRKNILPKILEEEKDREKYLGKQKVEEKIEKIEETE